MPKTKAEKYTSPGLGGEHEVYRCDECAAKPLLVLTDDGDYVCPNCGAESDAVEELDHGKRKGKRKPKL